LTDANSVHWGITNEHENVVLPSSGVFTYNVVGGTTPTDNFGATGVIGSSTSLGSVDFANHSANLNVYVNNLADPEDNFAQYNWIATYNGMQIDPTSGTLSGTLTSLTPTGGIVSHPGLDVSDTVSGSANGSFAGFSADGAPTAAVVSYEANRTYTGWQSGSPVDYQIRGVIAAELQP
jgi:hypothetical protein